MAAVLTGTPENVAFAAIAAPTGISVTVPADATAVYYFGSFYSGNTVGLVSVTLGGVAADQIIDLDNTGSGAGFMGAVFCAAWYNRGTGAKTLTPVFGDDPDTGPVGTVAYVKDGDTTAWRDADTDHNSGSTAVTVTLTTVSGDLVLKYDRRGDATVPSLSSGWTAGQTQTDQNGESARLSYISASGTSQVCDSEDESFNAVVAISIPAASGGGGTINAATIIPQLNRRKTGRFF